MVSSFRIFVELFRIGFLTVGSGYVMIPVIQETVVHRHKWLTDEEFMDALSVAQSAPGPNIISLGILIGWRLRRVKGFIAGALGTILPSLLIILAIAMMANNVRDNHYVIAAFKGVKPAVISLILIPLIGLCKSAKIKGWAYIIPLLVCGGVVFCGISPIYAILAAIIFGVIRGVKK